MATEAEQKKLLRRLRESYEKAAAKPPATASTPSERLLWAAENGQFEAIVAKARLAEPVAMVTPEEREAELRASGQWPADKPAPPAEPQPAPPAELEREPTPNEQYIAEHCHWRRRGPNDYPRPHHEPGRCLVEYDPIEYFLAEQEEREEDEEW